MSQLYAACRQAGSLVVRHVQLSSQLQTQIDGIFQSQAAAFMNGVSAEIDFTGDWKPDDDELLVTKGLPEAQILLTAAKQNAISLTPLDVGSFQNEGVKALFTSVGSGQNMQLLMQSFGPQQFLSSTFSVLHDGNVFRRLTEPAFTLNTQILAIINALGDVKFKSFTMLRRVFDLVDFYKQATDIELTTFCGHSSLMIADPNIFVTSADEGIRKAVHAVTKVNVLGNYGVTDIVKKAASIGFSLNVTVILPFLTGFIRRIHAASFSFCAGVIPPMPILGRSLLYVQSHCVA